MFAWDIRCHNRDVIVSLYGDLSILLVHYKYFLSGWLKQLSSEGGIRKRVPSQYRGWAHCIGWSQGNEAAPDSE